MKRIHPKVLRGLLSVLLLVGVSASAQAQPQSRIGTVDLTKIFDNYWKKKQAIVVLKERKDDMEKDLKVMVDDFNKSKAEYEKALAAVNDPALSAEERDRRRKVAEDKLKSLKDSDDMITSFRRQATANLDEQGTRMRNNILEEIRNVVATKARTAGFSLVIDTAADSAKITPVILFSNGDSDLTDTVIATLNAGAPSEPPPTEEKTPAPAADKKPALGSAGASSLEGLAPPSATDPLTGKKRDDTKK